MTVILGLCIVVLGWSVIALAKRQSLHRRCLVDLNQRLKAIEDSRKRELH